MTPNARQVTRALLTGLGWGVAIGVALVLVYAYWWAMTHGYLHAWTGCPARGWCDT